MKLKLCGQIVRNVAWLLSYDFWRDAIFDKEFQARTWASLILRTAWSDILLMVLIPGYPKRGKGA